MTDQQDLTQPAAPNPGPAIMRYFDFTHLTNPRLQAVSAEFAQLAQYVVDYLPAGPEQSVALRKLLEAKDAAVRAALDGMPNRGLPADAGEQVRGVMREPRVGEVCCGGGPVVASGAPAAFLTVGDAVRPEAGGCCRDEQRTEGGADEQGAP